MSSKAKSAKAVSWHPIAEKVASSCTGILAKEDTPHALRVSAAELQVRLENYNAAVGDFNDFVSSMQPTIVNDKLDQLKYEFRIFKLFARALLHQGIATPEDLSRIFFN